MGNIICLFNEHVNTSITGYCRSTCSIVGSSDIFTQFENLAVQQKIFRIWFITENSDKFAPYQKVLTIFNIHTLKKKSAHWNTYLYIVWATCTNTDLDSRYLYLEINNCAHCISYWKVDTCTLKIHIWILSRQLTMWSAGEILSFPYITAHTYMYVSNSIDNLSHKWTITNRLVHIVL